MNSKIWKIGIPFIAGIAIFLLAYRFIGIGDILRTLRGLYIPYYLLGVGCIFCSIYMWTLRWKTFVEVEGRKVSTKNLFKNLLVGLAINNMTPVAKLGGEPVRTYLLKRGENIRMREGLASVLADLTIFFICTLSLITIALFLIPLTMTPPSWILFVVIPFGIITALIILGIVGIYSGTDLVVKIIEWFGNKIERLKPYEKKLIDRYLEFQVIFRKCLENRKAFSKAVLITVAEKGFNYAKFLLIFLALGYQIDYLTLFIGIGISLLILSLPTTPGSLGVFESGFISVFVFLGVPSQIAATAVFLDRLVWFWGITALGGTIGGYLGIDILESKEMSLKSF